ncbi:fungal-specific transcription factor domain-containing protein [Bombardia bombarda]|uniref:Fungal-specific transcription factor domain-containing protein n=1 Tax=Bombardia bombarda TaxID=252184 RepID=A0AA39X9G7_9PEZI|nr:fungal-specific transcription factor domain-containing protein [Bombardia bombarda]
MDGLPHYSTNVINTSAASPPQTLPPLQPSNSVMQQPSYGSYPSHAPRTPATPNTPGSANNMASYPPPPPQNAGRGGAYPMMNNNPYPPQYTSSSMMPQTTTAASHPQPIAPAPTSGRAPPVLRPMPAGGVMPQPGMNSPYGQSPLMPQSSMLSEGDQPTHVVGSQGRRGILPSAPGKPAAPAAGTAAKNQIPQKDADGKFPCPHCTKTYLHAKHLKRHLLRHTGDRPYMCVLCRDTFSRSDILKRHFIKCSVRRGNPTGASHLSHPQAHVKKNAGAQQKPMGAEGDVNHINGMGNMPADGMVHPFGLIPSSDGMSNIANDQSQLSRSSSINNDANRDRRSMTGSVMGASTRGGSFDQSYNGGDVSNNMTANINPQLANYSMPQNQNGMPMFGGSGSTDWSQMFQAGAQPTYVNNFPPNVGQTQTAIKQEPNAEPARAVGIPDGDPIETPLTLSWGVPSTSPNSYQQLSTKVISFLYPTGTATRPTTTGVLNQYFQPDNIRDFLENYTHFHTHFSILHIPTFCVMDAYVGLVAGMCCVGACYSNPDRVSVANIREVMHFLKAALEGSSRMFASLSEDARPNVKHECESFGGSMTDIEELQAIMLCQSLFLWHGTPLQRENAQRTFPLIASLARNAGLLNVSKDMSKLSPIHQPDFVPQTVTAADFNWVSWTEQEKRIRIMYFIFLCDAALGLYFNTGPEFDAFEIHLPLPTDDAAWDANNAVECAEALGLYGLQPAKMRNPDGTQRCNQPQMHLVLKALLNNSYQMQPGATNLYGKFILIHALLAMMRRAQSDGSVTINTGSTTPLPLNAWFAGVHPGSGRATPVDHGVNLLDPQTVKTFWTALEKFKANWDNDMAVQFPPNGQVHLRRYGFSRDGIHFYWLATYLLKNTRAIDLQRSPDQRFTYIFHLLRSVKNWVMSDGASRGEELGSVGAIDEDYGVTDLTTDMTQLFRPLPR